MKNLILSLVCGALIAASPSFAAQPFPVEAGRVHTAAGANGCTLSGATNATPIVATCTGAHNFIDGDQVQITGVAGNTAANALVYVKVTSYSTTTFGLYSDANLTSGVAGNGSYTSGGAATEAYDISGITGDWSLKFVIGSMTAGKNALVSVQDSADGFVSDIRTVYVFHVQGPVTTDIQRGLRSYNVPLARFGVANARLRLYVQYIDSSASATLSLAIQK